MYKEICAIYSGFENSKSFLNESRYKPGNEVQKCFGNLHVIRKYFESSSESLVNVWYVIVHA